MLRARSWGAADLGPLLAGGFWEAPRGLARQEILVHRRLLDGPDALYVLHEGQMVRLCRLDPHFNATSGRAQKPRTPETPTETPPTASMLRYDHDHPSMLAPDGGYVDHDEEDR